MPQGAVENNIIFSSGGKQLISSNTNRGRSARSLKVRSQKKIKRVQVKPLPPVSMPKAMPLSSDIMECTLTKECTALNSSSQVTIQIKK